MVKDIWNADRLTGSGTSLVRRLSEKVWIVTKNVVFLTVKADYRKGNFCPLFPEVGRFYTVKLTNPQVSCGPGGKSVNTLTENGFDTTF